VGGRGAEIPIRRLKNYRNAVIESNKFTNYLLNPGKCPDKAKFFKGLGYNMKNAGRLEADIRKQLAVTKAIRFKSNKEDKVEYRVNMELGISRKAMVTTGWTMEKGERAPRFITAYPKR
jgi:hypothetical protein